MPDLLHFDEPTHTYTREGVAVPSVTQALGVISAYDGIPPAILAEAAERGTAVHKAIELHLQDDLDEASLDPVIAGYFYGYWKFERETGFKPRHSEALVYSAKYGYAGTLDLEGDLHHKAAIIDTKTTRQLMASAGPQTAAYEAAFKEQHQSRRNYQRYALLLKQDSTYRLEPCTAAGDFRVFLACLTVHNFKRKHHVDTRRTAA